MVIDLFVVDLCRVHAKMKGTLQLHAGECFRLMIDGKTAAIACSTGHNIYQ